MIQTQDVRLSFRHDTKRRLSAAIVSAGGRVVAVGFAQCSVNDQFSRRTGRKEALSDALARHPKPDRRVVWQAYFLQHPKDM